MAIYKMKSDIALLDRGERREKDESRYVIVENVLLDDDGQVSNAERALIKNAMSTEAVRGGAYRIDRSDCIDVTASSAHVTDDMLIFIKGGDKKPITLGQELEREAFLIEEGFYEYYGK